MLACHIENQHTVRSVSHDQDSFCVEPGQDGPAIGHHIGPKQQQYAPEIEELGR